MADSRLDAVYQECSAEIKRKYPDVRDQIKAHELQLGIAMAFASMDEPMDPCDPMLPEALRLLAASLAAAQQEGRALHQGTDAQSQSAVTSAWDT